MNIKKAVACLFGFLVVSHVFAQQAPAPATRRRYPARRISRLFRRAAQGFMRCAHSVHRRRHAVRQHRLGSAGGDARGIDRSAQRTGEILQQQAEGGAIPFDHSRRRAASTSDDGKATASSAKRLIASVSSASAEPILSGVQVVSREVDTKQQTVTVKVGVSRKRPGGGRAIAGGRHPFRLFAEYGRERSICRPARGGIPHAAGTVVDFKQTVPHADEF